MRRVRSYGLFILVAFFAAFALGGIRKQVKRELPAPGTTYQEVLESRANNAFARVLGEIRATAADLLYAKSETYMFHGVTYRTPQADVVRPGQRGISGEGSAEAGEVTGRSIIRAPDEDFRGLIGYLERHVKPYREPRGVRPASGVELLPWYRMMTVVEPANINGYISGSYWLGVAGEPLKAIEFADEGLRRNPGHPLAFQLHLSKATAFSRMRDFSAALAEVEEGLKIARAVRPSSGEIGTSIGGRLIWSELAEEDFFFLMRYRTLFLIELGRQGEALLSAMETFRVAPNDGPNNRILQRLLAEGTATD